MAALRLERVTDDGIAPRELRSGRPIIDIAQTGSDLSPCYRIPVALAERTRAGIRATFDMAIGYRPIAERGRRHNHR